jgi:hypothetical protein
MDSCGGDVEVAIDPDGFILGCNPPALQAEKRGRSMAHTIAPRVSPWAVIRRPIGPIIQRSIAAFVGPKR